MSDVRIYCTDEYKKKIKIIAVKNGMTVSDMLLKIVNEAISGANDNESLQSELESINTVLSKNGGKMTAEERQKLKDRRNEIRQKVILYAITTLHQLLMKQQERLLLTKKQERKYGEVFLNITVFSAEKMLYGQTTEKTYPQSLSLNTTHTKKRQSKCDRHLTVLIVCLTFIAKNMI